MSKSVVMTSQPGVAVTAITTQFGYVKNPRGTPRDWSTQLFGCFEDIPSSLFAWFLPPCFQCYVAYKLGESCCVGCCVPSAAMVMRSVVRERHNIQGSVCNDFCMSCWFGPCVLCQIYREVDNVRTGRALA